MAARHDFIIKDTSIANWATELASQLDEWALKGWHVVNTHMGYGNAKMICVMRKLPLEE